MKDKGSIIKEKKGFLSGEKKPIRQKNLPDYREKEFALEKKRFHDQKRGGSSLNWIQCST